MGENITFGSTSAVLEAKEPATHAGLDRLQSAGQQSVNQAQDGTWVVWVNVPRWIPHFFHRWGDAYDFWIERPGSYLCKNHTPV